MLPKLMTAFKPSSGSGGPTARRTVPAFMLVHTVHISLDQVDISARFFHALQRSSSAHNGLSLSLVKQQVHIRLRRLEKAPKGCKGLFQSGNGKFSLRPLNQPSQRREFSQSLRAIKIHEPNNFQLVPNLSKDETHKTQEGGESAEFQDGLVALTRDFTVTQVQNWLQSRDFAAYMVTFANYTGVDMLRLSREDLKALCGLSEGIRLFNSIHPELLAHKRTIYLLVDSDSMVYHPIFLYRLTAAEMCSKLMRLLGVSPPQVTDFYLQGPNDIHVIITDELVHHLQDEAQYSVDLLRDVSDPERYRLLLKPVPASSGTSSASPSVSG
ncbi:hypothetical protein WDU94_001667 [Cyamophila willieti]